MNERLLKNLQALEGWRVSKKLVADLSEFTVRLRGKTNRYTETLRDTKTFKPRLDPEGDGTILGLEDGYAFLRLRRIDSVGLEAFFEEVESIGIIDGYLPVFRGGSGEALGIIPNQFDLAIVEKLAPEAVERILSMLEVRTIIDVGRNRFVVEGPQLVGSAFIDRATEMGEVEFVEPSSVGALTIESSLYLSTVGMTAKLERGDSNDRTISLVPHPDHFMIVLDEEESGDAIEELTEKLKELEDEEHILVTSDGAISVTEGYMTIRMIGESESDRQIVFSNITNLSSVGDLIPSVIDIDGVMRFSDPYEVNLALKEVWADNSKWSEIEAQFGLTPVYTDPSNRFKTYRRNDGEIIGSTFSELTNDARFRLVEPVYLADDSESDDQEPAPVDGMAVLWNRVLTRIDDALVLCNGAGITVAVVDKLMDFNHPLLQGRLASTSEKLNFSGRSKVYDHGMHVAGIVTASDLDGQKLAYSPGANVLPIGIRIVVDRYANRASALNFLTGVLRAGSWLDTDANLNIPVERLVVNCSWKTKGDILLVRDSIAGLIDAGALVCCSAGNANEDAKGKHYPSDYLGVLCVAGTDKNDDKLSVSNFGGRIDISAPGGDGRPLDASDILSLNKNDDIGYLYGTSQAAPHVAAIAALVWSAKMDLTRDAVVQILRETAVDIDAKQSDPERAGQMGAGRVDAFAAVQRALE